MMDKKIVDWDTVAGMLRSMGHPVRLMILDELNRGAKCVRDVQEILDISQSNLSQHLSALKNAGLIGCHSNGPLRCYYLIRPDLVKKLLRDVTKEHEAITRPRESVIKEVKQNQHAKLRFAKEQIEG
jgi:ArsR family transcriptional regulator, arsenate/arsenite/antimonite-responsive transcriptional repressor